MAKALKTDVPVKAFFREGNYGRARLEDLLKIYAYHSPRVKYEFIDPDKNPGLVKRYEVTQDGTTIFECRRQGQPHHRRRPRRTSPTPSSR